MIKYPRTLHLPWSEFKHQDDKVLEGVKHFEGKEVVVTEKMDGENTSMYLHGVHARSLDSKTHESRTWVKKLHGDIKYMLSSEERICGENLYAVHSIKYEELPSYFLMFGFYTFNEKEHYCWSWDETIKKAAEFNLSLVPELYRGIWDEELIKSLYTGISKYEGKQEGYVVRLAEQFNYSDFKYSVGKFVRKNHIQTDQHWMEKAVEKNGIITI